MKKLWSRLALCTLLLLALVGCSNGFSNAADKLIGTWTNESDCLWVFDDNGELCLLYQGYSPNANPNNYSIQKDTYLYSVDSNTLSFYNGPTSYCFSLKFSNSNKLELTDPENLREPIILSRVKDSKTNTKAIVGTWVPFGYNSISLYIGSSGYTIKSLSFYKDGTYRAGENYGGEYSFLYDGDVLQMSSSHSKGTFDYQLFGDKYMLIEFSIYNGEMQFSYLLRKE